MMDLHELAVLLDLPNGYQLMYCLSHCGRIVAMRKDPFDVRVLLSGNDTALHKFTEDDHEVVSIVLDDVEPEDLEKYVCCLEAKSQCLAGELFDGAGLNNVVVR